MARYAQSSMSCAGCMLIGVDCGGRCVSYVSYVIYYQWPLFLFAVVAISQFTFRSI